MSGAGVRRSAIVTGLTLAPLCWLTANTAYAISIRNGGNDEDGAAELALIAGHELPLRIGIVAVLIGAVLVVPAVLGFYRIAGDRASVVIGGGLMAAGYLCYGLISAGADVEFEMAKDPAHGQLYARLLDDAMASPWMIWAFLLFVAGNLIGTTVLAIGLWRSSAAPVWVAVCLLCWPVLHVSGLVLGGREIPQVIGAVVQTAAFWWCARAVARRAESQPHFVPGRAVSMVG